MGVEILMRAAAYLLACWQRMAAAGVAEDIAFATK
jgi:hypothetical protein